MRFEGRAASCRSGVQEGNSLLYAAAEVAGQGRVAARTGSATCTCTRWRAPAWAGLLVTMINLLPIGQLDGGHIATAYFGNRYNGFARAPAPDCCRSSRSAVFFWVLHVGEAARPAAPGGWRPALRSSRSTRRVPWLIWFVLVGLMRPHDGRCGSPAGRRQAAAAQPARAVLADGGGVRGVFMPVPFADLRRDRLPAADAAGRAASASAP